MVGAYTVPLVAYVVDHHAWVGVFDKECVGVAVSFEVYAVECE